MKTTRKLQLAAGAVIANGLLALSALTPNPAMAGSCTPFIVCDTCYDVAFCQTRAPAGCTVTSAQCNWNDPTCPFTMTSTYCYF